VGEMTIAEQPEGSGPGRLLPSGTVARWVAEE
jgi:hypothetical protein